MNTKPIKKLYYSISEVAEKTELKPYILRYWETEFAELRPSKNRAGNRIYKEKDIQLIMEIKELLYTKKFTIEGARNFLKHGAETVKNSKAIKAFNGDANKIIDGIQDDLEGILQMLNN